jgi:hypothetical protein
MRKFDVQIALEGVTEARRTWARAKAEFDLNMEHVMKRLLHEAAANYMSAEEFGRLAGLPTKRVRVLMRKAGLDPTRGKRLLAKTAADALASNAELLGIAPHEMDLMSPLAYLPMGEKMRQELQDKAVSQVTELPDDNDGLPDCEGWDCQSCGKSNFIPAGFARVSGNKP